VLLTEGSSLTSREVITCLGPTGHTIEVLDPDPLCIARFSRWVHKVHRVPSGATDPLGYLDRLIEVVDRRRIDVVLPSHEQAWLLAAGAPLLPEQVRFAVATAEAFSQVQSKINFARLLDRLKVPQPRWRAVEDPTDLDGFADSYWLKREFSTAGQGVREVVDRPARQRALTELGGGANRLMAQEPAQGQYGQVQALFDHGRLVAAHTSVQTGTGIGGSAAARRSVDHPQARRHAVTLGQALGWHGGLTLDYLHLAGVPAFIECNPRMVEPANAAASGVNLPALQVQLSLGDPNFDLGAPRVGRPGVRTHSTLAMLLGVAAASCSRRAVLGELVASVCHRGRHHDSTEQLTPVLHDPASLIPIAVVAGQLLGSPSRATAISRRTVEAYSIGPSAITTVRRAVDQRSQRHPPSCQDSPGTCHRNARTL
jgi:hypothetical protein